MPDHATKQIRDHLVTILTGLTTTGARVYNTRVFTFDDTQMPGLAIYTLTDTESDAHEETFGRVVERKLTVMIEGRCKPSSGTPQDLIDQIRGEVETAIQANTSLGSRVRDIRLGDVRMEFSGELERPTGFVAMEWRAYYRIDERNPFVLVYL